MPSTNTALAETLARYADAVRTAYRNLPPGARAEAQLTPPLESFLTAAADAFSSGCCRI